MHGLRRLFLLPLLAILALPSGAALPVQVDGQPLPSLAPMLERVTPAVVNISTVSIVRSEDHPLLREPFFRWFFDLPGHRTEKRNQSLGSGVIVDARHGHVLTNNHVIEQADEIWLTSSTREVGAVVRLNGRPVGDGTPGPLWHRMYQLYQACKARLRLGATCNETE